ncbi:MAG: trifunctional transcriptional activator/DNA repair protein Ada/methylated-DNA--[protein]-cysteine S-methyltransferase [Pseudomonadota bacterium]
MHALFDLPSDEALYAALLSRDSAYEGRAYVCVASTGIFCRLTCPARKPKRENCTFYGTVGECLEAGYRACKRCQPLADATAMDPMIGALLNALEADPTRRWLEADVQRLGYDPSTVRKHFKRQFGMTFLEMARQRRLKAGFDTLRDGGDVIDAQLDARFDSPSAFRSAFAQLLGCAPSALDAKPTLMVNWLTTPLGDMISVTSRTHLHLLEFFERKALKTELNKLAAAVKGRIGFGASSPAEQIGAELEAYFAGTSAAFKTPVAFAGTPFQQSVWRALVEIPPGETRSYADIARTIGQPTATRAVARANGANQLALIVPCHRVIGADGSLAGYGGGLWRKQKLLEIEACYRPTTR